MSALVFRPARREDVAAIVALLADDVRGRGREDASLPLDRRYFAAFERVVASAANHLVVGEASGEIVACAQLTFTPGLSNMGATRATIEGVRVAASQRGQGIGAKLIAHLVAMARAEGAGTVQLTTNKSRSDAHRFYAANGFTNSHEGFKLEL